MIPDASVRLTHSGMVDALERVSGRLAYTINLDAPLQVRVLRSTRAHARIVRVDVSRARNVSGVAAVVTGNDLVARGDILPYYGPVFRDQPMLAIDKVRYVGEPVVAVAARDLDAADQALSQIEVEYEELPTVFDAEAALDSDAPLVHEAPPQGGETFADIIVRQGPGTNVCNHFRLRKGDIERGLADADVVFEDVFSSPAVQHVPMETHACIAEVKDGHVTVWATTQSPHPLRSQLAELFGIPLSHVRVLTSSLGGGYGGKAYATIEPLTVAIAMVTGQRVKFHLSREDEFLTVTKHPVTIRMTTGLRTDGTILARRSVCYFNTGAYALIGPRLIKNGGLGTGGPHNIEHVAVDSYAIYTNNPPAGAFRGYGIPQAAWAYDTQLDMIAERMQLDPLELRMKNLLQDGDHVMTGEAIEDAHFRDLLRDAAAWVGWEADAAPVRRGHKVRAKGLSCIIKSTVTPSTSTAMVKLNEDASLDVLTSSVEMGQGVHTAMAIIAAEALGLSVDRVRVSTVDTDATPYDQVTGSSRSTFSMGRAVQAAVEEVRRQLLELATDLLEVGLNDLQIVSGRVEVKGVPSKALSFADVVRGTRSGNLQGQAIYRTDGGLDPETGQGIGSVHWHQAAGAAEVEVDLETGKVEVLRYHAGVYAGRIINAVQAELQTEGNVAFGLGQALYEEMVFDGGQLQNGNLGDYMIASIQDMPAEIGLNVFEHASAKEVHGIGEISLPPVLPAIGNAVYRATGVRICDLPITPEKVLTGLRTSGR